MQLSDAVTQLRGVGGGRAKILENANVTVVSDLLNMLPYSYEDSTHILTIAELFSQLAASSIWEVPSEKFTLRAKLVSVTKFKTKRGFSIIQAAMEDETSTKKVRAIWFNQDFILNELREGNEYLWYGKIKTEKGTTVFQSPKFEEYTALESMKKLGRILPVYRRIKTVTTTYLRKFIEEARNSVSVAEYIPLETAKVYALSPIQEAYRSVHAPTSFGEIEAGKRRIALQELLEIKQSYEEFFVPTNLPITKNEAEQFTDTITRLVSLLPFALTESQLTALEEIKTTIVSGKRLDSFVYGDVGSGKTIVALLTAFAFSSIGKSSILTAPTTILASQHIKTAQKFAGLFTPVLETKIVPVLAGKDIQDVQGGMQSVIYIGTHAILFKKKILEDDTVFFVCIDEQHRFGVGQRKALDPMKKRHVITLSATPIPRTLAKSFLGFSQSVIMSGKPVGRKEIITKVVPFDKEAATYEWIRKKIEQGESAYLVFPRVEGAEDEKRSLFEAAEALSTEYFNGIPSGILYGGMKEGDKHVTMSKFAAGEIRLLFSTTVIEVGVDVPAATIMAIHGAELFGLAQLHQLRGRVGRSNMQSYCFVFPGDYENEKAMARLTYFSQHANGLDLAEYDLSGRGMGTILGAEQSGISELKVATLDNLALLREAVELYELLKGQKIVIPSFVR